MLQERGIQLVNTVDMVDMGNMKFTSLLVAASSLVAFGITAQADNASDLTALRANCQQAYAEFQSAFTAWANAQKYSTDAGVISRSEIAFWQADSRMQDLAGQAKKLTLLESGPASGTEPLDTTEPRPGAVTNSSGTGSP
jgi:hypothetical protein